MGLFDFFRGRSGPRPGRTAIFAGPKRLREEDGSGSGPFGQYSFGPAGVLYAMLLTAAIVFILDFKVIPPMLQVNTRPTANVHSRLDYSYHDPSVLESMRKNAAESAPRVYQETPGWTESITQDLSEIIRIVEVSRTLEEARDRAAHFPNDSQLVEELYRYHVDSGERRKILSSILLGRVRSSLSAIGENGIITQKELDEERTKRGNREILRVTAPAPAGAPRRTEPQIAFVPYTKLRTLDEAARDLFTASWRENLPLELQRQMYAHTRARLTPNLKLDEQATAGRQEQARIAIGKGDVRVKKGELIADRNSPLLSSDIDKIYAENRAYKRALPLESRAMQIAGLVGVVACVVVIALLAALRGQRTMFQRRRAVVMLGVTIVATLIVHRALMMYGVSTALTPFILLGMTASLAFGQGVALVTMLAIFVLTTVSGIRWEASPIEGGVNLLNLAMMAGGLAAALPAQRLRARWDLLKYGLIGGFVQFVLTMMVACLGVDWAVAMPNGGWGMGLAETPARAGFPTMTDAALALVNGPFCGLLMLGSLPLIESIFGILTNIRLLELAQTDHPALRLIQDKAPGTFTHTLAVRSLAEPAAEAVGANRLLVGTGVLYHDIGKVLKPEYFVENQMGALELHRRLRPSVSALLITAHVKDGIELAREFGLPQQIIDFIPEHHGTTLVTYFYHSAKKQAEAEGEPDVDDTVVQESFFRYPGPRPQSRESAIVMIADTVEAATRTLDDPSPARLATFVHELIMAKMLDGQFDECDLTFADLKLIEEAFVRVLVTRFHSRVRYPGQDEDGDIKKEADETKMLRRDSTTIPTDPERDKEKDKDLPKDNLKDKDKNGSSKHAVLADSSSKAHGESKDT